MVKSKTKKHPKAKQVQELDGIYILKIVMYLIVGSQWVRLTDVTATKQIPLPIGLVIGLAFAMHDHFQIDRKIEFAILIIAAFIGFWAQSGVLVAVL